MTNKRLEVRGGVDTTGGPITVRCSTVPAGSWPTGSGATAAGYRSLLAWLQDWGQVVGVGVEGTGTYGAGLARYLPEHGVRVVEVDRPDRKTRRFQGKSDPIDAIAAARAVLAGTATGVPKTRTGPVVALRMLRVARRGAVKARFAALNQLHGLLASAPEGVRAQLRGLSNATLVARAPTFRIREDELDDPQIAVEAALRAVVRRICDLDAEIALADRRASHPP